jgi:transcriptional regulator with XRE-family HTH domain
MVLSKRVGVLLREARESRKLSIRDVARETNITPKYIESLENEDYSQFPGETYALGFLRSYSEYLNLDTETVINLYRGLKIDQTQTPVKELTRPNRSLTFLLSDRRVRALLGGVLVVAVASTIIGGGIYYFMNRKPAVDSGGAAAADLCEGRRQIPITLPSEGQSRIENLSGDNQLKFVVDTLGLKLCLKEIDRSAADQARAVFHLRINDEKSYSFRAGENETVALNHSIPELSEMTHELQITPQVLGEFSVRVMIEPGAKSGGIASGIRVTLEFVEDSYVEWVDDGNTHQGVYISSGEKRTLEARNRLEIKVGNGGGVRILRDGQPPRIAGPRGRIAKISYRRIPDPLDPGMSRIQEAIEVVR